MNDAQRIPSRTREMTSGLALAPRETLPSKFWEELNRSNLAQLTDEGYENFKRTVALNYFTWIVPLSDVQIRFLWRRLPKSRFLLAALQTIFSRSHPPIPWKESKAYSFLTRLIWEYAAAQEPDDRLEKLEEPLEGNPPRVYRRGRLISQDLANAKLEFRSILHPAVDLTQVNTILELGAGYGRTAFVFLTLLPTVRYIVADIPPALAVCERYLSSCFKDRRIFRYRPFRDYAEVREEFEAAQIIFLLPHQLALLPKGSADLFMNISSFDEMRKDQIGYYFKLLAPLVRRYFYLKGWKVSENLSDGITVKDGDYPIPADWKKVYWKTCAVQEYFFEALFELP